MSKTINTNVTTKMKTNATANKNATATTNANASSYKTIDLEINNYTIGELISFFKLKSDYTLADLEKNEREMTTSILSESQSRPVEYKYDIITFIKVTKNILAAKLGGAPATATAAAPAPAAGPKSTDPAPAATPGNIINPYSSRPTIQIQNIPAKSINPYNSTKISTNYVFNSLYRDDFFFSSGESCTYTLPKKLTNVTAISLSALQFPNTMFSFTAARGTNQLYIFEYNEIDDEGNPILDPFGNPLGSEAVVTIEDGTYTTSNFPAVLERAINEQVVGEYYKPDPDGLNRFRVSISPYTNFLTITNTTFAFLLNITLNDNPVACRQMPKIGREDPKYNISPQTLIGTMGYQIGFRQISYDGEQSYTTEAQFNPTYSQYIYFTLNDFVNNQSSNTYGMLPGNILDSNILGVIPVMGAPFANSFDNNANFINKVRQYNGPVNISKIQVKLLSPLGQVLNLHFAEFTFVLQVESLYDNTVK
jgi:hypothetical protein